MLTSRACSIKFRHPEYFRQAHLFRKALAVLESHHFKLPARRFSLDLFDKDVLRRIVLGDEDEESDSEGQPASDSESMDSE